MNPIILTIIVGSVVLALWSVVNFIVCVVVWATGQLIESDKKIVAYLAIMSFFFTLGFGGTAAGLISLLDHLAKIP